MVYFRHQSSIELSFERDFAIDLQAFDSDSDGVSWEEEEVPVVAEVSLEEPLLDDGDVEVDHLLVPIPLEVYLRV